MNILSKLSNLNAATASTRVAMTEAQVVACRAAIKAKQRGYNVQPNSFDVTMPYRVAINYNNVWDNFGNFSSADVAAAVGTIVSAAYFGEKAHKGAFDQKTVEASEAFTAWLDDPRNTEVIARANGELPCIHQNVASVSKTASNEEVVF